MNGAPDWNDGAAPERVKPQAVSRPGVEVVGKLELEPVVDDPLAVKVKKLEADNENLAKALEDAWAVIRSQEEMIANLREQREPWQR